MSQTGAELLVDCLEAEGVEYVFGIPGEELEDLLFAIRESGIETLEASPTASRLRSPEPLGCSGRRWPTPIFCSRMSEATN